VFQDVRAHLKEVTLVGERNKVRNFALAQYANDLPGTWSNEAGSAE